MPKDTTTSDTTQPNDTAVNTQTDDTAKTNNGIAWWWLIVVGVGALALGAVGEFFGKEIVKKK